MIKTTVKIDGMMCPMCEAHISEAIRKAIPSARQVSANRRKGEAVFLTEQAVDGALLRQAIDATGYRCLGVESAPHEKTRRFQK